MFQSAVGWDYQTDLSKHESQTDAAKGFGGKYGVQKDSQDVVRLAVVCVSVCVCVCVVNIELLMLPL